MDTHTQYVCPGVNSHTHGQIGQKFHIECRALLVHSWGWGIFFLVPSFPRGKTTRGLFYAQNQELAKSGSNRERSWKEKSLSTSKNGEADEVRPGLGGPPENEDGIVDMLMQKRNLKYMVCQWWREFLRINILQVMVKKKEEHLSSVLYTIHPVLLHHLSLCAHWAPKFLLQFTHFYFKPWSVQSGMWVCGATRPSRGTPHSCATSCTACRGQSTPAGTLLSAARSRLLQVQLLLTPSIHICLPVRVFCCLSPPFSPRGLADD